MATANWRTINIDLLDPESSSNFPTSSLLPSIAPVSASEVQTLAGQIRQLLRGGDTEGALRGALENAPYGGDATAKDKEIHLQTVTGILQSTPASSIPTLLTRIFSSAGGPETLDTLMKYLYKGMSSSSSTTSASASSATSRAMTPQQTGFTQIGGGRVGGGEGGGQAMSVLLSWHEKVVEVAGAGCIVRVMTDRRTV
ncbi:hypothetical protein MMC21_002131 [Puttea exsequens]|nr:hypothetical protein [Puttea exsequens]